MVELVELRENVGAGRRGQRKGEHFAVIGLVNAVAGSDVHVGRQRVAGHVIFHRPALGGQRLQQIAGVRGQAIGQRIVDAGLEDRVDAA
ncbi:hypothetical protein D3C72_1124860 [compost metagenome]